MIRFILFIIFLNFIPKVTASEYVYTVKKRDNLSGRILPTLVRGPIWGKNGSLAKTLVLNPQIKNQDLIYPGMKINFKGLIHEPADQQKDMTEQTPIQAPLAYSDGAPETVDQETLVPPSHLNSSWIELSPFYNFTGIEALSSFADVKASVSSQFNAGLSLIYGRSWSSESAGFLLLKLSQARFSQPLEKNKVLVDPEIFLSAVGLGVKLDFNSTMDMSISTHLDKKIFVSDLTSHQASLKSFFVPVLQVRLNGDILKTNSFKTGLGIEVSIVFGSSASDDEIKTGNEWSGIFYLKNKNIFQSSMDSQIELNYSLRHQDTDKTSQTQRDLGLMWKWIIPIESNLFVSRSESRLQ